MYRENRSWTRDRSTRVPVCPTGQRLAEALIHLQNIKFGRNQRQDPIFAKLVEERTGELLDRELQAVDEQVQRISDEHSGRAS